MNLNQVTLPALDIPASKAFYEALGLELIVDSAAYARFLCTPGNATFSIHLVEEAPSGSGAKVYFELENLDEKVEELITKGFVFKQLPQDESWGWREARLLDPAGNELVLYKAGENRIYPPWGLKEKPEI
ncbi:MAG: VOC family protein [Saprospiraceae bacterium]